MKTSLFIAAQALFFGASTAKNFDVNVGKGGNLRFEPESLDHVVAGDTVTYHFFSQNHAVAQSTFDDPCHLQDGGFFSGFVPTESDNEASPTTFSITVNNTNPIWIYCPQTTASHCQSGMVHAINAPTEGNTLSAYRNKASGAKTSNSPEDGLPRGGLRVLHIDVGFDGNSVFQPNNVQELLGTLIQWRFNPANHTVSQSSFDEPCKQLEGGFSSGFVPTSVSPSGVLFETFIHNDDPIWFYCAQTFGSHCQRGMVGSVNAPTEGKTFEAYRSLAKDSGTSTIGPDAPVGGVLSANGSIINELDGIVLTTPVWNGDYLGSIPQEGWNDPWMAGMAGGGVIDDYAYGDNMTDDAARVLGLIHWFENILLETLMVGHGRLDHGEWRNLWPRTIVDTIGAMAAQSYMHRCIATDSLQHFDQALAGQCELEARIFSVDRFLEVALTMALLDIGLILSAITSFATSDPWLVPAVASSLGPKARMAGVLNLMQDHVAAAAPREVAIPPEFVYSYALTQFVASCPDDALPGWGDVKALPFLEVTERATNPGLARLGRIRVRYDRHAAHKGQLWLAFLGPWGDLKFAEIQEAGYADVPTTLFGHAWIVVTTSNESSLKDLYDVSVAGPELIWISQP